MKITLIRHGKTKGNLEGRYIGSKTDESLCDLGLNEIDLLKDKFIASETPDYVVYSSPMKRATETANILFSEKDVIKIDNLIEIDFGDYENKNYEELNGNKDYQAFIDSGGTLDYPNGEKTASFIERSVLGFEEVLHDMEKRNVNDAYIVCHGGNIMAIMSQLTGDGYFDYQVKNLSGYKLELKKSKLDTTKGINVDLVSYSLI